MLRTTMGRLLVNEALPKEMQDHNRVLDKKGMNTLLRELAEKHPEKYVEVSKKLNDIGRTVATEFGGYTFGLQHLRKSGVSLKNNTEIQAKMRAILGNEKLTPQQRKDLIVKTVGGYQQKQIDDIYDEAVKANNPLAMQVVSGSRGNRMNLGSLLGSDMLYSDHRDDVIPLPVLSSYSQGLKPIEYWASTYGARRGTMATKFATQDAGFLSKQLNQIAHRLMVTDEDDPRDIPNRGLPVDTDDGDNEGALLAKDFGPYKRNTVLNPKILRHLKSIGHDRILVRSPLVGGSPDGGVYARDVGVRERGVLPGRGEQVGLTAAQALSEPLSQGQLSAKHSGGVAGQEKAVGGFAYINQLIQVPKRFKGGATHAETDGTISSVEPAPAGGNYVWIGDKRHYVPEGVDLKFKKGDPVEAGDVISEGFPNPDVITEHKGIGEGRRYFVNAFSQAMRDAGMKVNRRNVELLSRGLINHVKLTDEFGDHVPDDIVPYSTMEQMYEPRDDHQNLSASRALGKYLEKPVLHYSIGTKVRPSVLKELQHFGVEEVAVHNDPPPFQAHMIRGMYSLQHDPDWMTRMYGSGLKASLLDSVHHGGVSDEQGTSFIPSLARAVDFGRGNNTVKQPEKGTPLPPEGQPFGDPRSTNVRGTPKPSLDLSPSISSQAAPAEKKKTGFMSGLFKMSSDKPSKVRALLRIKQAAPHVDSTVKPSTGSSTGGASPVSPTTAPAGMPGHGPSAPSTPMPASAAQASMPAASQPGDAQPSLSIMPPEPQGPPGSPTTPALPGQVHPGRMPQSDSWAGGLGNGYNPNPGQPQNPNSFTQGYVPGQGMMHANDDPEMAAQFVQGGGDSNDPSSGFGGQFGAVTRFGSLMDPNAVSTLTGGDPYVRRQHTGDNHDNLIGGQQSDQIYGGMNWNGLLDKPVSGDGSGNPAPPDAQAAAPPEVENAGKPDPRSTGQILNRVVASPVTSGLPLAAAKATRDLASKVPGLNQVPGLRPAAPPASAAPAAERVIARQVFGEGGEQAAKLTAKKLAKTGFKFVAKALPGIGWVLEAVDVGTTPMEELRGKFDAKMKGEWNGEGGAKDVAWYFADNVLSPGKNIATAGIGLKDAYKTHQEAGAQDLTSEANRQATLSAQIDWLENTAKRRALTPDESAKLEKHKTDVAALASKRKPSVFSAGSDDGKYQEEVLKRQGKATQIARNSRMSIGEASMQKVLEGTATPFEQDCHREWVDALKASEFATPKTTGGYANDLQSPQAYTDDDHARLDDHYKKYIDMAMLAGQRGNKELAEVLKRQADRVNPQRSSRDAEVQKKQKEYWLRQVPQQTQQPLDIFAPKPAAPAASPPVLFPGMTPPPGGIGGVSDPSGMKRLLEPSRLGNGGTPGNF